MFNPQELQSGTAADGGTSFLPATHVTDNFARPVGLVRLVGKHLCKPSGGSKDASVLKKHVKKIREKILYSQKIG